MELAGAVWADLFLGALALVIRPLFTCCRRCIAQIQYHGLRTVTAEGIF